MLGVQRRLHTRRAAAYLYNYTVLLELLGKQSAELCTSWMHWHLVSRQAA